MAYASVDRDRVVALARELADQGWSVWWDRKIPPGKTFDETIEEALDQAKAVVAVWTKAGVTSRWVRTEAAEGAARGILVPVLMEDVRLPLAFRRIQVADLTGWEPGRDHAGFTELINALNVLIGTEPVEAPPPEPEDPVERAVLTARVRATDKDWEGVIALLGPLAADTPTFSTEYPDAAELLALSRNKWEALELYEEAEVLYADGRWNDVVGRFDRILELDPDLEYGTNLKKKAERHLASEQEQRLGSDYERATQALDAREWPVAIARYEQLLAHSADYRDAAEQLERARAGAASEHHYRELSEQCREGRWDAVIAGMAELAAANPDFGDPDSLVERAEAQRDEAMPQPYEEAERATAGGAAAAAIVEPAVPAGGVSASAAEEARREAEEAARLEAEKAAEEEARREAELARREAEEEAATAQRQAEEIMHGEAAEVGTHQAVEAAGEAEQEPRGDLEEGRGSEAPSRWDRKRFGLVAVVVVLIAGLAAVVVVLATTGGDDTPSTTAAAPTVATDPGTATDPAAGTEPGAGTEPAVAGVDLAGTAVTVLGLQLEDHQMEAVREALTAHAIGQGIEVDYSGDPELGDVLAVRVAAGDPPDIVLLGSLGEVAEYADSGWLVAVPDDVAGSVAGQWPADWMQLGSVDDTQYGIPTESGPKSLVYYKPARFAALGYDIPATWDELRVLTERAIADGQTPWCVGIESGEATGWVFTDWVEDLLLRITGADFYDRWTAHDVPFNSPEVEAVWGEILELWNTPGAVYSGGTSIVAYPFLDNGFALAEDRCLMHRQAAFLASSFGPWAFSDGEIDVFYLPALDVEGRALLAYGTYAVALRDAPEVWAMVAYLGSAEYAEARQRSQASRVDGDVSGFLSANTRQDLGVYSPIEQKMVRILQEGQPMRFDASDLMPPEVGFGSFWVEGTKAVNGDVTVTAAVDAVEASWP